MLWSTYLKGIGLDNAHMRKPRRSRNARGEPTLGVVDVSCFDRPACFSFALCALLAKCCRGENTGLRGDGSMQFDIAREAWYRRFSRYLVDEYTFASSSLDVCFHMGCCMHQVTNDWKWLPQCHIGNWFLEQCSPCCPVGRHDEYATHKVASRTFTRQAGHSIIGRLVGVAAR